MGRMLGAFDDPGELDRPDLNKCPDCECFFSTEECPLCGKICPEDMRAGNRKPPKKVKKRHYESRTVFVEWYHSWWFIILALIFFPIVGIVLLITSPHKRSLKITLVAVGAVYMILSTVGIGTLVNSVLNIFDKPIDTSLSRDEYIGRCQEVDVEDFYRSPDAYDEKFVSMTLTVESIFTGTGEYYDSGEYSTYYICRDVSDGKFRIIVRNCIQDKKKNLAVGDVVTVFGEGAGMVTVWDENYTERTAPCLNAAYADIERDGD